MKDTERDFHRDLIRNPNPLGSEESIFCQVLGIHTYPDALFLQSNFHSGGGQACLGSDHRQRADMLVVDRSGNGVIQRYYNYDGILFHGGFGNHLIDCPKRKGQQRSPFASKIMRQRTQLNLETCSPSIKKFLKAAMEEAEQMEEENDVSEGIVTHRTWYNIYKNDHDPNKVDYHSRVGEPLGLEAFMCRLKKEYCESMSLVDPSLLKMSFEAVHHCDIFDNPNSKVAKKFSNGKRLAPMRSEVKIRKGLDSVDAEMQARREWLLSTGWNPREMLRLCYPEDSCLGFDEKFMNEEEILEKLMSTTDSEFSGFVVVKSGVEDERFDSGNEGHFGYVMQRCFVNKEELGSFTRFSARMQCGGDRAKGDRYLDHILSKPMTMTRKSLHDRGECMTMNYLRFLIRERGFKNFKLLHMIVYDHRKYLSDFVIRLLQLRHDLKKNKGSDLTCNTLKLLVSTR